LLAQEERPCGEKQRKAHAPKMPRDSLYTEKTAAREHTHVSRGSKQS
jgi:hypothetical protein